MALVRDIAITLPAMTETILITCSVALDTGGSTTPSAAKSRSTADVLVSTGLTGGLTTGFGRTIDRLAAPLGAHYTIAYPAARAVSTRGSTEAERQIKIGCYLQHGDSSGAGDMAEYSTDNRADDRTYFGTGRTTDMLNWTAGVSTGTLDACSNPVYYDLRAAKRYVRVAVRIYKSLVTTESSGDEHARISASLVLGGGDVLPQTVDPIRSPYSSTTSTA